MICALTRLTNAIPLCIAIVIGIITLVKYRQWKCIIKNGIVFTSACILVLIPFVIYFTVVNGLYDMFFGTIIFNIQYIGSQSVLTGIFDIVHNPTSLIPVYAPLWASFMIGICCFIFEKKYRSIATILIVSGIVGSFIQMTGYMYLHYLKIWIPVFVVTMGLIPKLLRKKNICKWITILTVIVLIITTGTRVIGEVDKAIGILKRRDTVVFEEKSKEIIQKIPEVDKDKVLAYNVEAYFYMATNINPCFKYFVLQDWQCSHSKKMEQELEDFFESEKAKYIVTSSIKENNLDYIIREHYVEVDENDTFRLYKLKNINKTD